MLDITNIPPPRVPVIDDRTGLMSREWYRFLLNLFRLSGSGSSDVTLTDLQLAPQSQVDFGDLNDSYSQAQLSYLPEQVNSLQGEIDSLKTDPTPYLDLYSDQVQLAAICSSNQQEIIDLQNRIDTAPVMPQFGTVANYNFDNQAPTNGVLYSSTSIKTSPNLTFDGTNLGVGITPSTPINVYSATDATILVQGDNASTNLITARYSNDTLGSNCIVRKYRGSVATPTSVASGDALGIISFQAYGGTNIRTLAQVRAFVDTYTSDTNISSYLTFTTSPSGSAAATERMRIDSSGNLGVGTSSPGAKLDSRGTSWFSADSFGRVEITPTTGNGGTAVIRQYTTSPRNGGDLKIQVDASIQGGNLLFATGGSSERMRITSAGDIHPAPGTTSMTNGFFYIPASAGAPTGVPTAISGVVPMYYDTTNNKFYVYNGAWKSVILI